MNSQEYAYRAVEKSFHLLKTDSNKLIAVNHSLKITSHECCCATEDRVVKHVR